MSLTEGKCAICGAFGPLTEEHIPPRAAFNKCTVLEQQMRREGWMPSSQAHDGGKAD